MSKQTNEFVAACGLDCETREIRRVPFDDHAAEVVLNRFSNIVWSMDPCGSGIPTRGPRGDQCSQVSWFPERLRSS